MSHALRKPAAVARVQLPTAVAAIPRQSRWLPNIAVFALGAGIAAAVTLACRWHAPTPSQHAPAQREPASYLDLLAMSPDDLARLDIAFVNLICAMGLPGAENLDIPAILKQLDAWAAKVKFETERHLYRVNDPRYAEQYVHSEARLRCEFIVQVLQEDFGVHYNPARFDSGDYRNSQDLFLHGLVGSTNGGTCASMPLAYTAVGRRLGYPMKLVLAGTHVFCRWDDEKERLNLEGAGDGVSYFDDSYYRTLAKSITDAEIQRGEFLKSLTPAEELSSFLIDRGTCLDQNGRVPEARAAFAEACRLMPQSEFHVSRLAISMRQVFGARHALKSGSQEDVRSMAAAIHGARPASWPDTNSEATRSCCAAAPTGQLPARSAKNAVGAT